ncbi:DUF6541 family protein [Kocuria sp. SM24M-10]|uniref:DUF6541 family protein n=1 Tax=Kocuria sp. SM24M-10 TaxID=1660349 RepID=UPI00064ACB13|nr:DUF6541 family protein [Kocuria sp. SM24M-10]KLU10617.1 hypothetical protein ABL57_05585 [Kocuria sp. SM24M-10]
MLTGWWPYLPAFLVLLAFLWLPGLALLWAFGQRGGRILLTAPAFSVAVVGLTGVVLDLAGVPYGVLSQVLAVVVLTALAWLVGRLVPRGGHSTGSWAAAPEPEDPESRFGAGRRWLYPAGAAAGLVIGALLLVRRMSSVIGAPEAMAQRWDNIYHLNAIRYVVETGNGSTLTLNRLVNPDSVIALYPAAWHQLASLAVPLTGDNVLVAHNLTLLAVAGVVWPASCIFLARCLVGPSPVAAVAAGTAAAGFSVFPLGLMAWGPLFPNILALAIAPVSLGLTVQLLGPGVTADRTACTPDAAGRLRLVVSLVVTLGALFVSQPNAFLALLAVAVPLGATAWWLGLRASAGARLFRRSFGLVGVAVAGVFAWLLLWTVLSTSFVWVPSTTVARAVGEALFYGANGRDDVPWVLVALTAAGIYAAVARRRLRWLVVAHLVLVYLYAVAAAGEEGPTRQWLVGGWYTDSYRLAATLPLTAVPLVAFGTVHVVAGLATAAASFASFSGRPRAARAAYPVAALVLLGLAVPYSQVGSLTQATRWGKQYYAWEGPESILNQAEYELLQDLDELTEPGDVIAVNPWNGGSLAYAVADRAVTQYHIEWPDTELKVFDPDLHTLATGIDDATPGSAACAAAEELDVRYVLDFGNQFIVPNAPQARDYSGLNAVDPAGAPGLALVEREGPAALYEVVGCDAP